MFWNTDTLKSALPKMITDFNEQNVESANYTLRIGQEVYISPVEQSKNPVEHTKILLEDNQGFAIPPGQFGLLMTEEEVTVPKHAIAFISIRSKYKFRGLINVSGFHVDPGYKGKLVFAVFNAGPSPVHMSRGERCFHIWFANLDSSDSSLQTKNGYDRLDSSLIQQISDQFLSLKGLSENISVAENRLSERMNAIQRELIIWRTIGFVTISLLVPLIVGLAVRLFSNF